ncbi:ATP-binding protein [Mesotoga prima]|jgi:serine/threonine-protein kinase RsbW|uniref:ATP-binding protein n=1 Tax=Mesotoga prima TaxID=1184387 RepID=UPI002FE14408
MEKSQLRFSVEPSMTDVDLVSARVSEIVRKASDNDKGFRAGLVVIEACTNIVKHGSLKAGDKIEIEVNLGNEHGDVVIAIIDSSTQFSPLDANDPNLGNLDVMQKGGMGIYLIKRFSKDISYRYVDGRNILTVTV